MFFRMAIFIPEKLATAGAKAIHIKRTLSQLDDHFVVRSPFQRRSWLPDFLLQHAQRGWLAMAVCDLAFAHIPFGRRLFEPSKPSAFEALLQDFQQFDQGRAAPAAKAHAHGATKPSLPKVVLMWRCNRQEVQHLTARFGATHGLVFVSKEALQAEGAALLTGLLAPLDLPQSQALLAHYFPEAEVPARATTRRLFVRDNRASLGKFFLDYNQEWAAKLDLRTPQDSDEASAHFSLRLVNGVAGSGKTLIAVARAMLLAELNPEQKIVVLIHNTPVVADLKAKLIRTHGALPANLRILTFFSWATSQWMRLYGYKPHFATPSQIKQVLASQRSAWPQLAHSDAQLLDELDFINDTLLENEAQYLQANRTGRGFALREKERSALWGLYQAVTQALATSPNKSLLWSALPRGICLADDHRKLALADHVLIDEAQFFAPAWFQAVRLGMQGSGSLFLCADPNQGFMKNRLSWKSAGLEVAGRTKKLHRSYRTTQAILSAANSLLQQHTKADAEDFLEPDLSGMESGQPPVLIHCDSQQDSIDRLLNEMELALQTPGITVDNILVVFGDPRLQQPLYERLRKRFGEQAVWSLNHEDTKNEPPHGLQRDYLRMASVATATGLEAGVVFLIGMEALVSASAHAAWQAHREQEARTAATEAHVRKLYMAMTRAGQSLVLLASQPVAAGIARHFKQV